MENRKESASNASRTTTNESFVSTSREALPVQSRMGKAYHL